MPSSNDACKETQEKIADRTRELTKEMAADGVKDVFSIGYSRGDGQYEASMEYESPHSAGLSGVQKGCAAGMLTDGIHPTAAGCDDIATYVLKLMEDNGMRR